MAEGFREILSILSSEANIEILMLLSTGEYNTREIARILGRDETDVSRRLSKMRSLGLVESYWARVAGRNVKLYRLKGKRLVIDLSAGGVSIEVSGKPRASYSISIRRGGCLRPHSPPSLFVGREKELAELERSQASIVVITGLPGVGKTSLASKYYEDYEGGPKYWYSMSGLDYLDFFVKKMMLCLASETGNEELVNMIRDRIDYPEAAERMAETLNRLKALLVIDDYHKHRDKRIAEFLAHVAQRISGGKLFIVSRTVPKGLPMDRAKVLRLEGLPPLEAYKLVKEKGVTIDRKAFVEVYIATQGHPGLLNLLSSIAIEKGMGKALTLLAGGSMTEKIWKAVSEYLGDVERKIVSYMLCFDEPIPHEILEGVAPAKNLERSLETLEDKHIVKKTGHLYEVTGLLRAIAAGAMKDRRRYCRHVFRKAGDYYLAQGSVEDFFKALRYYALSGYSKGVISAIRYRLRSISYRILDYIESYGALLEEIESQVDDYIARSYVAHELGVVAFNRGEYRKALNYFKLSLNIAERIRDHYIVSLVLSRYPLFAEVGLIGEKEAVEAALSSLKLIKGLDGVEAADAEFGVYANLARLYYSMGRLEEAYRNVLAELRAAEKHSDPFYKAIARFHVAIVRRARGEESTEDLLESYSLFKLSGLKNHAALAATVLARILLERGEAGKAWKYAQESIKAFEAAGNRLSLCEALGIGLVALMAQNRWEDKAAQLAERIIAECEEVGEKISLIAAYCYKLGIGLGGNAAMLNSYLEGLEDSDSRTMLNVIAEAVRGKRPDIASLIRKKVESRASGSPITPPR